MLDGVRALLLRVLRVPLDPAPPRGARDVRVFRASRRFYRYRLVRWALKQAGTLIGLVAGVTALRSIPGLPDFWLSAELFAVASFVLQLPVTYAALRLDYELRWYIVTDRSLRIREGLTSIREQTMTFANIQNVSIRQNPLQRLLGIADVEVRSAGGGGKRGGDGERRKRDMHVGLFRGVDDAHAIRNAVLERIRLHRDAGLGDPEDEVPAAPAVPAAHEPPPPLAAPAGHAPALATRPPASVLAAARELAAEARALRLALGHATD